MKTLWSGSIGVVGICAWALCSGAVGCGTAFDSSCQATRTCPATGGSDEGGAPAVDEVVAGAGADAEAPEPEAGGTGAAGATDVGNGGQGPAPQSMAGAGAGGAGEPGTPPNPPPYVTEVTPSDAATNVEPSSIVRIQLSEPVRPDPSSVRLMAGGRVVEGEIAFEGATITFTPKAPFALLQKYSISVSTALTDLEGAPMAEAFASSFDVRDGAWSATPTTVASGKLNGLADVIPITTGGDVLVAWSGASGSSCPVYARWFNRGVAPMSSKTLSDGSTTSCAQLTAGGNAAGTAVVLWQDYLLGNYARQFDAGAWLGKTQQVSSDSSAGRFRLAVTPAGEPSEFEANYSKGTSVRRADATGVWNDDADFTLKYAAKSRPGVAFDSMGNGLALWHAFDAEGSGLQRIVAARYSAQTRKWTEPVDVTGSVSNVPGEAAQLGAPAVAFDAEGGALAAWVDVATGKVRASRYRADKWEKPLSVSGAAVVSILHEAPGLAFDGTGFVVAWTAEANAKSASYTVRYDLESGWGSAQRRQANDQEAEAAARMPRLVSDGRGNLLLVWARGNGPKYELVCQRFSNAAWGTTTPVPGGALTDNLFTFSDVLPLAMNGDGLAALAWANYDANHVLTSVRLASFF